MFTNELSQLTVLFFRHARYYNIYFFSYIIDLPVVIILIFSIDVPVIIITF